ncbi:glycosyltransferase family 2 protein [Psychromonas sp.]|uniref:glycosyltransferase family 2 protein n=1 Tax=Psychromonas sp. TaxID=1884585 RepID=UPI003568F646
MSKSNISVIIPLYNKAAHISKTLNSIYQQQSHAFEVIVVNDGSTDNSLDIVQDYKAAHNLKNLTIINQPNSGVSIARNNGALAAKSPFVAFLDGDDIWLPLYLTQIQAMIDNYPGADMFACKYQCQTAHNAYKDAKIKLTERQHSEGIFADYFVCAGQGDLPFITSTVTIKRSSFIKFGMFPVNEAMGEDQALFSQVAIHGRIAYSPDIHVVYNLAADNRACISNIPSAELPFSRRLTEKTEQLPAIKHNEKQKKAILTYCAAHLCHIAKLNIQAEQFKQARALLADKRCWLKPKHKIGLYLWSLMAQGKNLVGVAF